MHLLNMIGKLADAFVHMLTLRLLDMIVNLADDLSYMLMIVCVCRFACTSCTWPLLPLSPHMPKWVCGCGQVGCFFDRHSLLLHVRT